VRTSHGSCVVVGRVLRPVCTQRLSESCSVVQEVAETCSYLNELEQRFGTTSFVESGKQESEKGFLYMMGSCKENINTCNLNIYTRINKY
jgi:hypothetical protein